MVVVANVTGKLIGERQENLEAQFAYFSTMMAGENSNTSMVEAGLGAGFQTQFRYIYAAISRGLLKLAIQGIYFGLGLCFVVIAGATADFTLTFLTTLSIACSVAALISTMVWMQWDLGTLESICVAVLVGLSVDYSLHFAVAWRSSALMDRQARSAQVLKEVGISVVMASFTTMASAVFLCICYITFYNIFGIFVLLAIFYSTLFSFGMLMAMLTTFGPMADQNDFLRVVNFFQKQ